MQQDTCDHKKAQSLMMHSAKITRPLEFPKFVGIHSPVFTLVLSAWRSRF